MLSGARSALGSTNVARTRAVLLLARVAVTIFNAKRHINKIQKKLLFWHTRRFGNGLMSNGVKHEIGQLQSLQRVRFELLGAHVDVGLQRNIVVAIKAQIGNTCGSLQPSAGQKQAPNKHTN